MLLSHGRGSNPLLYAWFAETLAAQGYVVAGIYHYRANTYDQTIAYLANKLWQRPRDLSLAIDLLLNDPAWGKQIDAERIGVAGHSQGGFTSLWIGGAKVDADKYLAFQKGWKGKPDRFRPISATLCRSMQHLLSMCTITRIKAAFAMAPGIIKAFGMDRGGARRDEHTDLHHGWRARHADAGRRERRLPAKHIPGAELVVIPGLVDHEIFVNECDDEGRDEFPEACIDAPGVDRHAIHEEVGAAALQFFGKNLQAVPD